MTSAKITTSDARDHLVADMKAVIADAEDLLKATAGETGEHIRAARARAAETLKSAKTKLMEFDGELIGHAKDAAKATDDYVHEHPWHAVGIAAVAGILVGVLVSRR